MKRWKQWCCMPWPLFLRSPSYALSAWPLFVLLNFGAIIKSGTAARTFVSHSSPDLTYVAPPNNSETGEPFSSPPNTARDSLVPLLPSPPMYPFLPSGPVSEPAAGFCNLNFSVVSQTLERTAGDCAAPLAMYVRSAICCPQFVSMLRIFQGELSRLSGSLVLNSTEATQCLSDTMTFLVESGANNTVPELCSLQPVNLTGGSCPVTAAEEFELLVNSSKLLAACSSVDPLKECCKPVCEPAITDAAVRLASRDFSSLQANDSSAAPHLQHVLADCKELVLVWLASQLGTEAANSAFRNLFNCQVNRVCPLVFADDPSPVVEACRGTSPSNSTCCSPLYEYISRLQQEMLITNMQALDCVTLFGSKLRKRGVTANVYDLCHIDLKDFSLQVHGQEGCLLRAVPSDIVYDSVSGISFTCDLNDNIAAPWPHSSSLSFYPICGAADSLPAFPVSETSAGFGLEMLSLLSFLLMLLCINTSLYV